MQNNLYTAIKNRMLEEMNDSIKRHPLYANKAEAYHRLHMNKERPQAGVVLESTTASRMIMSPDDFLGEMKAHFNLVKAGTAPGTSIEWVWEDAYNITKLVKKETAQLDASRRIITTENKPLTAGPQNTEIANNIGQVKVYVNGIDMLPSFVDGANGKITLATAAAPTDTVEVTYYYSNLDDPGFYFIEMADLNTFNITPMLSIFNEVVIEKTTGTESTATLAHNPVLIDYILTLHTKKNFNSTEIFLDRGIDYDIATDGTITFLLPLQQGTTLYATYRYQGADRGPFTISDDYQYHDKAIKGAVLAFGSRRQVGDKQVVYLAPQRERVASVYGGHYVMNLEWKVFTRDPISTAEFADHLESDLWGNRKEPLRNEGITIQDLIASGESEEVYDDSTGNVYFQNTITMEILSEWKKFVPHMVNLNKFNFRILRYSEVKESFIAGVSPEVVVDLQPLDKEFKIVYPQLAYPVFY